MTTFACTFRADASEPRFGIGMIEGWPMTGPVSLLYGVADKLHRLGHSGMDIPPTVVGAAEPVYLAADAFIEDVFALPLRGNQWDDFKRIFGNSVIARHADCYTLSAHLAGAPLVQEGKWYPAGTLIGYTGNTGTTDGGVHLHFAVARLDNRYFNWPPEVGPVGTLIDPLSLIPAAPAAAVPPAEVNPSAPPPADTPITWSVDPVKALRHMESTRNALVVATRENDAAIAALKGS